MVFSFFTSNNLSNIFFALSNLKIPLTNITNAINTLQSLTTNDSITSFQTIEDNFDTLEATKLDKSVYDDTIAPEIVNINSALSTMQSLQAGDVTSFNTINTNITNLTNTKHPLITSGAKLNSDLLNRNDNLQYVDISSSLQTKLDSLDSDIALKNDVIDGSNKLAIANVDLGVSALSYVDISSSLQTKLNALDTSISGLSSYDVAQTTQNTSFTNSIASHATTLSTLTSADTAQTTINTNVANSISVLDTFKSDQETLNTVQATTNSTLQTNIDNVVSTGGSQTLAFNGSGVNIFDHLNYSSNLPAHDNNETEMSFTLSGLDDHFNGDYKCIQSCYNAKFDFTQNPVVQLATSRGMSHLFTAETYANDSYYRSAHANTWFKDTSRGAIIQYLDWAYDSTTSNYVGNTSTNSTGYTVTHSTTATNSITYSGEYFEFHFPFLFEISKVIMTSGSSTIYLPSETALLGSADDGETWEFIDQLSYDIHTVSTINHSVSTTKKYSRFKLIFERISFWHGFVIEHLDFEGDVYSDVSVNTTLNSFITTQTATNSSVATSITDLETFETAQGVTNTSVQGQVDSNITDIATNVTDIATNAADIVTANTNIATNVTDIATNATNIATNATDIVTANTNIATANTNIATNVTDIATNATDIVTANTNIATNVTDIATNATDIATNATAISTKLASTDYQPKIDSIASGTFASDSLAYTFDESTIYMNQLTASNPFELDLTISSPANNKTYKQKMIIDCLEFKGYANTLKINTETVEIKYLDGDGAINLAPIAGYSNIMQTLEITRIGDAWFCLSKMQLFFNSTSNVVYDETPPVITVVGDAVVNHEINSGAYSDAGATAMDNVSGNITGDIVVSGDTVDHTVLAAYTIVYTVSDAKGNTTQVSRVVNVIDTTNPVVTLTGASEISVDQHATYTELGATASDNSNESLTVVITNSPDTSIAGDVTVLYTATDSSGNSHQIGRLVHVVGNPWVLEYSNPSTELFEGLIDMYTNLPYFGNGGSTTSSFTMSGNGNAYLNGNYSVTDCWHHGGSNSLDTKLAFQASGAWSEQDRNASNSYTDSVYGFVQPPFNQPSYVNGQPYQGHTSNNSIVMFYSHTVGGNDYNGLFHIINLPFFVEPTSVEVHYTAVTNVLAYAILGSPDGGTTWDFLGESTSLADTAYNTVTISTSTRYNTFKYIYTVSGFGGNNINCKQLKLFGDVYSYIS